MAQKEVRARTSSRFWSTAFRSVGAGNFANAGGTPPFNFEPVGSSSTAVGLQQAGQPQTLSAIAFGDTGCSSATTGSLRAVVVELG